MKKLWLLLDFCMIFQNYAVRKRIIFFRNLALFLVVARPTATAAAPVHVLNKIKVPLLPSTICSFL